MSYITRAGVEENPPNQNNELEDILNNFLFAGLSIEQMGKIPKWLLENCEANKPKTAKLIQTLEKKAREEAVNYFYWRIDCNTLISELEGWRGCIDNAKDQTERHFAQLTELQEGKNNENSNSL